MKRYILAITMMSALLTGFQSQAQKSADPVLFTYGGNNVTKSEFLRMYTKNINNQKPDFSEKALREYMTLYSRFKMKVAEAEQLRMDTLPNINNELGTYKKQLAKTYLTDNEVTDKLVLEANDRMKTDVRVAHILITVPRGSDDTVAAYRKIDSLYKSIQNGADFGAVAKAMSEDRPSGQKNGDVGFFTAMQIPAYNFENVAYSTPVGAVSQPFKTAFGYHIIKKLDQRPSRGEIQVAQILLNVKKSGGEAADKAGKTTADSILIALRKGANFENMVEKYSEDKFSKNTKGLLASFGVGQMMPEFEDAAFALKKSGDYSEPVKTEYGYHIIKLIKKTPLRPYDSMRNELKKRIEKDGRIDVARDQYTYKIKQKLNYKDNPTALMELINAIPDSTLRNGTFNGSTYGKYTKNLFEMTGTQFTQADFANYIQDYTKGKIYGAKELTLKSLFKNYAEKALYDYQENKLIDENDEYRNLLTEYKDGIMLFELTDRKVWSKASQDTTGLDKFYQENKSKYMWPANIIKANLYRTQDEEYAKRVVKALNDPKVNQTQEEVGKAANGDGPQNKVVYESGKFERSRFPENLKLEAGKYAPYYKNDDGSYSIVDVKEIYTEPTQKTLSEARGYIISDYQEYLEKQWIANLEATYPVSIKESTLKAMIKK
jgi:peptidyl-prolyl cis-trans isomerase SurA